MPFQTTYQAPETMLTMESILTTTLRHNDGFLAACMPDSVDSMSVLEYGTAGVSHQDHTVSPPTYPLWPIPSEAAPTLDLLPSLSSDFIPSNSSISTSNLTWIDQTNSTTHNSRFDFTENDTSTRVQQAIKTRPRGRPRKDLSKKQATPPPSDSLDKYRAKNRRASARCREKERSQAAALEKAVIDQEKRSCSLKQTATALREELFCLQMEALQHGNCGHGDIQQYNERRALAVATAWDLR